MFSNTFYNQIDGVAMGSPCGPALVNIIICSFENKQFKNCSHGLISVFYKRYVDDMFVLLSFFNHAEKVQRVFILKHSHKNFCWFLNFFKRQYFLWDRKICQVYRKKTFSCVYTNFNCCVPETYKTGLMKSLLFQCFSLYSDFANFHHEINTLKIILYKNNYPRYLCKIYKITLREH